MCVCERAMKRLTDSQSPQNQAAEGTWPRRGGGRCQREGETGTKQRRRWGWWRWWSSHALSTGKREKEVRSTERADYFLTSKL